MTSHIKPGTEQPHALSPVLLGQFHLDPAGLLQRRATAVIKNFDLTLPASDPQFLESFRTRNSPYNAAMLPGGSWGAPPAASGPGGSLVAWSGEYPGKWLTHCAELWRLTRDPELKAVAQLAVDELAACQAADGYLAPWSDKERWSTQTWDSWGHYHCMLGCLLWAEATADPTAQAVATKIADVICAQFPTPKELVAQGGLEQNMAILHSMAVLYTRTHDPKLLAFCNVVLAELQPPVTNLDFLRNALAGREFYQGGSTRWEALCGIMGFAELYHATGDASCGAAYSQIWWSICKHERHNHGGIFSNEAASGSPYSTGSVETCCTVTWGAMCVEMLKMTGSSLAADELELSLFNSGLFLLSPSGRWCVYDSPMDGVRQSTTLQIGKNQNKDGCSELSCCAVNGPRMVGLPADWAVMCIGDDRVPGFVLNFFSAGYVEVPFATNVGVDTTADSSDFGVQNDDSFVCINKPDEGSGGSLKITQATEYPVGDGSVTITLQPTAAAAAVVSSFRFWLRIPAWSKRTTVTLNGKTLPDPTAAEYLKLPALSMAQTHSIELRLDFRLRCWVQPAKRCPVSLAPNNGIVSARSPKPFWTSVSAGWKDGRRDFAPKGAALLVILGGPTPIEAGPTTGCAWLGGMNWTQGGKEMIPFSFGAKESGPGFSRALSISQTGVNYFGYQGTGTGANPDIIGIVDAKSVPAWSAAMSDSTSWHHVALTDDGTKVTLLLDGVLIGGGHHPAPPTTAAGAVVGGWGIDPAPGTTGNREYIGALAGVELYTACLARSDVAAAMHRTKPADPPPAIARRGCFYRGPLLLGYDPTFNLVSPRVPPPLDPTTLETNMTVVSAGLRFLEPALLVETKTAAGTPIRLCDYGSLGLAGTSFSTWFELAPPPDVKLPMDTEFTKADPTRTFFLDSLTSQTRAPSDGNGTGIAIKLTISSGESGGSETRRFRCSAAANPAGFQEFRQLVESIVAHRTAASGAVLKLEFSRTTNLQVATSGWKVLDGETWSGAADNEAVGILRVQCSY